MAAPVIDSVNPAGPVTAVVGDQVAITVTAHDADAKTMTLQIVAKDAKGHPSQPVTVPITWTDPLTIEATASDSTPVAVSGMVVTVG